MIELRDLKIPDTTVVPEPTAEDIQACLNVSTATVWGVWTRVVCYLARRVRELEERDKQAAEAYSAKCETQKFLEQRITELEAEAEQLTKLLFELAKMLDHNWVTHQRVVAAEQRAMKAEVEVERLRALGCEQDPCGRIGYLEKKLAAAEAEVERLRNAPPEKPNRPDFSQPWRYKP